MKLDANIWGPHFWFFLHTIAFAYPKYPNAITKKTYYNFIQNIPTFIPVEDMSKYFQNLLTLYPVTPYLDSNKALVKWTHFIHNKVNEKLEKNTITLNEFYNIYNKAYESIDPKVNKYKKMYNYILYFAILITLISIIIYLSNK